MLKELSINNLAIIRQVNLDFSEGITVITGETGAGKSIILEAFELLLGKSAQTQLIRTGKESLVVEGVFELPLKLIEKFSTLLDTSESELIIRREITLNRQNKVFINGRRATGSVLKELFEDVVEIIGQNGNQLLFSEKNHLHFLDELLTDSEKKTKQLYQESYKEYSRLKKSLSEFIEKEREGQDKCDLFRYQLGELTALKLTHSEEERVHSEFKLLSHAEEIQSELGSFMELFNNSVFSSIKKGSRMLAKVEHYHSNVAKIAERIESLTIELQDIMGEIESISESVEVDSSRLEQVGRRLDELMKVKVKYRLEIPEILDYMNEMESFVEGYSHSRHEIVLLEEEIQKHFKLLSQLASELRGARHEAGKRLEERLVTALHSLGMPNTQLKVEFTPVESFTLYGTESAHFMISVNKGESLKLMSEVLSGGEGSRVILALKTLFSEKKGAEILILDEIDMGVGGKTVEMMAQMIKALPQPQVICITHSAPIAAIANHHLYIEKQELESETEVVIREVKGVERVHEIARMIAGNSVSTQVLEHVKHMLERQ